jgi:hypothetical protein
VIYRSFPSKRSRQGRPIYASSAGCYYSGTMIATLSYLSQNNANFILLYQSLSFMVWDSSLKTSRGKNMKWSQLSLIKFHRFQIVSPLLIALPLVTS